MVYYFESAVAIAASVTVYVNTGKSWDVWLYNQFYMQKAPSMVGIWLDPYLDTRDAERPPGIGGSTVNHEDGMGMAIIKTNHGIYPSNYVFMSRPYYSTFNYGRVIRRWVGEG